MLPHFRHFYFTVFHPDGAPNDTRFPHLSDGPTLSGRGTFYVYYPNPGIGESNSDLYDKPETFRLCIDNISPLLRWVYLGGGGHYYMMGWEVDTRLYANGPHKLTVASWLYFQTGDGFQNTVEVQFDNPVTELTSPPLPPENPNLPVLLSPGMVYQEQHNFDPK